MPAISIHKSIILPAALPQYSHIDIKKYRRYELCLGFVQTIISDFFPAAAKEDIQRLFCMLGNIACCIDMHLDDLDITQKEILLQEFPVFFDALPPDDNEEAFTWHLSALCNKLGTALYPPSAASMLYSFHNNCREKGLLADLKDFSVAVIRSGVNKAYADSAKEVLGCLTMEGQAAIDFLFVLLKKEKVVSNETKKIASLKNYLQRLERMLNIADDLSDCRTDKRRGTIRLATGFSFYATMSTRLFRTFFSTLYKNNLLFLKHFAQFTRRYIASELNG